MANSYKLDIGRWRDKYRLFQPYIDWDSIEENRLEKLYFDNIEIELRTEEIPRDEADYRESKASMWGKLEIENKIITEMDLHIGGFFIELSPRLKQSRLIEILEMQFKKANKEYGIYHEEELDNIAMVQQENPLLEMDNLESRIQSRLWNTEIIERREWKTGFGSNKNSNLKKNLVRREEILEEAIPIICKIGRRFGDKASIEEMKEIYLEKTKNWIYNLPMNALKQVFIDSKRYKEEKYMKDMIRKSCLIDKKESTMVENCRNLEIQWL